ncbi:unnamed protein product, partial [Didymodactylos carnosus]
MLRSPRPTITLAIAIQQKSVLPDHASLGTTYNNVATAYKSLTPFDKTFEIQQKPLSSSDLNLTDSAIGNRDSDVRNVRGKKDDYSETNALLVKLQKELLKIGISIEHDRNLSSSHEHVYVSKQETAGGTISIQSTPDCCTEIIGLTLTNDGHCVDNKGIHDQDPSWANEYSKVRGIWSSVIEMQDKMTKDIESTIARPSRWLRTHELFSELWTQQRPQCQYVYELQLSDRAMSSASPSAWPVFH